MLPFDLVVAAGNVIPLLALGTEPEVVRRQSGCLTAATGATDAHRLRHLVRST